jgi:lipopolysaccharide export system permease protein
MHRCHFTDASGSGAMVADKVWDVELPQEISNQRKQRASDMTWDEMRERGAELRQEIDDEKAKIALLHAHHSTVPEELAKHLEHHHWVVKFKQMEARAVDVEMQMRPALALGCLCFVLVGCPVGIWFSKSDYLSAFITCFLPIVFIYYPLLLCGINLAKTGRMPIALCLWTANGLMALVAFGLFRRLLRN